jgi:hypothetical protein
MEQDPEQCGIFRRLTNQTAMSLVQRHCSQSAIDTRILFYLCEEGTYALFGENDQQHCENFAQALANARYFFVVLTSPTQIQTVSVRNLWLKAQRYRVIIAGVQRIGIASHEPIYAGRDLSLFLQHIERQST